MEGETRRCPRCERDKALAAFGVRTGTTRPTAWCTDCKVSYDRDWYRRNKQRHDAAVSRLNARVRARNRQLLESAKNVPCADCGKRYPTFVMDFDHVRGQKVSNVSQLAVSGASEEVILAEIAKCDVVCANCHRERTHGGGRSSPRSPAPPFRAAPAPIGRQLRLAFERRAVYCVAG